MSLRQPPFGQSMFIGNTVNLSRAWREWFDELQRTVDAGGTGSSDLEATLISSFLQSSLKAQIKKLEREVEIPFLL